MAHAEFDELMSRLRRNWHVFKKIHFAKKWGETLNLGAAVIDAIRPLFMRSLDQTRPKKSSWTT